MNDKWPELQWNDWKKTADTVHLFAQIIGKIRLALMPHEAQWQQVPFNITTRGLESVRMPYNSDLLDVTFDFISHNVTFDTGSGKSISFPLKGMSVAEFYSETMRILDFLNIKVNINPVSVEMLEKTEFKTDTYHKDYDENAIRKFLSIINSVAQTFEEFRSKFWGKQTPVCFFWGSFDVCVIRYSGKPANPPQGADLIYRVAMDAEQFAVGFWPGDDSSPSPAFFAYTYPKPEGLENSKVTPDGTFWSKEKGEFILPYEIVRTSSSPEKTLLEFCNNTYNIGSELGNWDKKNLERIAPYEKNRPINNL